MQSKRLRIAASYVLVFVMGIFAQTVASRAWDATHPIEPQIVTKLVEHTKTVEVPGPITTKTIQKTVFVEDTAQATKLLEENKQLKVTVTQLTESLAAANTLASGQLETPVALPPATQITFRDWRLTFVSDGTKATYALNQKFEVLSTSGRQKDGTPLALVKLFEIGPGEVRTELQTETKNIFTDQTRPSWHVSPAIQAGAVFGYDVNPTSGVLIPSSVSAPKPRGNRMAVIGLQWLKYGKTAAAEDATFAVLTPVVAFGKDVEIGMLPVSWNVGKKTHILKDVWVSPYVNVKTGATSFSIGTVGFAVTATF